MATTLAVHRHRAARAIAAGIAVAATFLVPSVTPEAAAAADGQAGLRLARQALPPAAPRPRVLRRPAHRRTPRLHSFHFGVDVSCPDGTPVYATIDGGRSSRPVPPRDGRR